jgi:hypothetical protein
MGHDLSFSSSSASSSSYFLTPVPPLLAMSRGGNGVAQAAATPTSYRRATRSVAAAQLHAQEVEACTHARPSTAGAGAQSVGYESAAQ